MSGWVGGLMGRWVDGWVVMGVYIDRLMSGWVG